MLHRPAVGGRRPCTLFRAEARDRPSPSLRKPPSTKTRRFEPPRQRHSTAPVQIYKNRETKGKATANVNDLTRLEWGHLCASEWTFHQMVLVDWTPSVFWRLCPHGLYMSWVIYVQTNIVFALCISALLVQPACPATPPPPQAPHRQVSPECGSAPTPLEDPQASSA